MPDYDNPEIEEQWCAERQAEVAGYLKREGVVHGRVGEWPAWHLAPYASVWAIESAARPGWVGWWVICGDLPCDYISSETIKHPRDALREFGRRWGEVAGFMEMGQSHPTIAIGPSQQAAQLAPQLKTRASILANWVTEEALWVGYDER